MVNYLWIALGSALGGMARFWAVTWLTQQFGRGFPFGTLFVNVSGSFVIGFLAVFIGVDGRVPSAHAARNFLMVGILGGYTTFSSFSLDTLNLARAGQWAQAAWNIGLSFALCLLAVVFGFWLAQLISREG